MICSSLFAEITYALTTRCAQIDMGTRFWAAGMAEPQPLEALRELRWLVSLGAGVPLMSMLGTLVHWQPRTLELRKAQLARTASFYCFRSSVLSIQAHAVLRIC